MAGPSHVLGAAVARVATRRRRPYEPPAGVRVVADECGFEALADAWRGLVGGDPTATVFQGWEANLDWWLHHRAATPAARLHVVCIHHGRALRLILPAWLDGQGTLSFLQMGSSDLLDVVCPQVDGAHSVLARLAEHLQGCPEIRRVRLTNLRDSSPLVGFLPYHFAKQPYLIFQSDTYSRIDRALHDEARILGNLDSKRYNDLRNVRTRIGTEARMLRHPVAPFPREEMLELLGRMEAAGVRDRATYAGLVSFCAALYERGAVGMLQQWREGRLQAMSAVVDLHPDEHLVWLDFYDPSVKNINLKTYLDVLDLAKAEGRGVNLGTGAYPYKVRNFAPVLGSLYTFHYDKGGARFAYYHLRKAVAKALGVV